MSSETWSTVPLGSLCDIYDGPHATPKKTDRGPIYLGISNLANGLLDLINTEHVSEEDYVIWTRRITPQSGDVVFSYETRLGQVAMIPPGLRCCLGRRLGLLRAKPDKIDPRFLLYAYLGQEFQDTIRARTIYGSTVERISLIEMPLFPIAIPPMSLQKEIADILSSIDNKIFANSEQSRILANIRDLLLPKLLSREKLAG